VADYFITVFHVVFCLIYLCSDISKCTTFDTPCIISRDVQNRFFKFWMGFGSFKKNSDSVQNEFGSVRFKKLGSVRIL